MSDILRRIRNEIKDEGKRANEDVAGAYFDKVQEIRRRMNEAKVAAVQEAEKPFLEELREIEEEYAVTLKLAS